MRKLLFYVVIFPGSIILSTALLFALLAICQAQYPSVGVAIYMSLVLWLAVAVCMCAGVQTLARRWEV